MNKRTEEHSCGAVLYTLTGEGIKYLLVCEHSGFWSFPKGHMENAETERETAKREIREETGLAVEFTDGFCETDGYYLEREGRPNDYKQVTYFLASYRDQQPCPQDSEVSRIGLFSLKDALTALRYDSQKRILTQADAFIERSHPAEYRIGKTEPYVDERDFALLKSDKYTFAVLDRILRGECELIRSDHEKLILCHSSSVLRYPVWLWTPDGASEEEKEAAWLLMKLTRPLTQGFRCNMKYELADHFIEKGWQEGLNVGITMQLYAYDCPKPIKPTVPPDGHLHRCTADDVDQIADLLPQFYEEIGDETPPLEDLLQKARDYVSAGAFYFWKDGQGRTVACCSYRVNQGLASLGSVYTVKEYRRKHYAQQLVWEVTRTVHDMGFMPMLYTNADYPASNACYEKIGYVLRGRLCTVAHKKEHEGRD